MCYWFALQIGGACKCHVAYVHVCMHCIRVVIRKYIYMRIGVHGLINPVLHGVRYPR